MLGDGIALSSSETIPTDSGSVVWPYTPSFGKAYPIFPCRFGISAIRCQREVSSRIRGASWNARAIPVKHPEIELRFMMLLGGSLLIPLRC